MNRKGESLNMPDHIQPLRLCRLTAWLLLGVLLSVSPVAMAKDDLGGDLGDDVLEKAVTPHELEAQMRKAMTATEQKHDCAPLLECLDILVRQAETSVSPEMNVAFAEALLKHGRAKELAPQVPVLLQFGQKDFSPVAAAKLNLGIKLALVFGGATFHDLRQLQNLQGVDLEWLLPALGKTGGAAALPLIQKHRSDAVIIPLGDVQNIRPVPCAAILASAYTGDEAAVKKILEFYEEDTTNLPRFAFYVSWGLSEGLNVAGARQLLAFCQHRANQAERLLDFRGRRHLPELIAAANDTGSLALTGYVVKSLQRAAADQVVDYLPLLAHPVPIVKAQVLDRILEGNDTALRAKAFSRLREMTTSGSGADRVFALESLLLCLPDEGRQLLPPALARETNCAVRVRLEDLQR